MGVTRSECAIRIRKALDPLDITDDEIEAVVKEMGNIRSRLFNGRTDVLKPDFIFKGMEYLKELRYQAARRKVEAAYAIMARRNNISLLKDQAFAKDPVEAIKSKLFSFATRRSEGGNFGAFSTARGLFNSVASEFRSAAIKKKVDKILKSGTMDSQILLEMHALRTGKNVGLTKVPEALEAAKIINGVFDRLLQIKQKSGATVRKLTDYLIPQTHDAAKIRKADADPTKSKQTWVNFIWNLLDHDRSFGDMTPEQKVKYLSKVYDDIQAGTYGVESQKGFSDEFVTFYGRSGNVSQKMARSRQLHFKDADTFFQYNSRFGAHDTIAQAVESAIRSETRKAAMIYHFGPNPEAGVQRMIRDAKILHKDDPKMIAKIEDAEPSIQRSVDFVMGKAQRPGQSLAAKAGQIARAKSSILLTGSSVLASIPDMAQAAGHLSAMSGKNFFSHFGEVVLDQLRLLAPSQRRAAAQRLAIVVDDTISNIALIDGGEKGAPGAFTKAAKFANWINGMQAWVESARTAQALHVSSMLAENSDLGFQGLPEQFRENALRRYGMGADHWSILRRAVEDSEGRKLITPEAVLQLSGKPTPGFEEMDQKAVDRLIFDTHLKLLTLFDEQTAIASSSAGGREIAWVGRDEGMGVLARIINQFTTAPRMVFDSTMRLAMSNPNRPAKTVSSVFTGGGDNVALAQLVAMTTLLGYLSISLKDFANNKTPRDPSDINTWRDAFVRGGAFGVYTDAILGYNGTLGPAGAFVGPVGTDAVELGKLVYDVTYQKKSPEKLLEYLVKQSPNHLATKVAFDQLFLGAIKESLNPGHLLREEQRTFERGQSYLIDSLRPTEAIR